MKFKILMTLVSITLISGIIFFVLSVLGIVDAQELVQCIRLRGNYKFLNESLMVHKFYCDVNYPDAGKVCTASAECEGLCLISNQTKLEPNEKGFNKVVGGSGVCSKDNTPSLCSRQTIENPSLICY